jgi:tRNA pseudouridine13 synthase
MLSLERHCADAFSYAGTKDKRAVTVQQVTAFKVADGRLAALNSRLWCRRLP